MSTLSRDEQGRFACLMFSFPLSLFLKLPLYLLAYLGLSLCFVQLNIYEMKHSMGLRKVNMQNTSTSIGAWLMPLMVDHFHFIHSFSLQSFNMNMRQKGKGCLVTIGDLIRTIMR